MNCDWDSLLKPCMENVELMWNTIKTKILEGIEKYIPVVLIHFQVGRKRNGRAHYLMTLVS